MYVLDTDHLSEIISESGTGKLLAERLERLDADVATSIVAFEELLRGWLAKIHHHPKPRNQVSAYRRLDRLLGSFASWDVLSWDDECVEVLERLIKQRVNVKPMDLKIAAIVLSRNALLLSKNLTAFGQVAGLQVEDWTS